MKTIFLCILLMTVMAEAQNTSQPTPQPSTTPSPQPSPTQQQDRLELNTELMTATFQLRSVPPAAPFLGTGFILGRPFRTDPGRSRYVLITAAHVLQGMGSDSMLMILRKKMGTSWLPLPWRVQIKENGKPLWVQHPNADVAAMYVSIPDGVFPHGVIPTNILADNDVLKKFEIHPGDELNVLGFPLGFASASGFPVLRSGKIASYPLTPTSDNPYFLLDFRVFKGNSGGPVYMVQNLRAFGGAINAGNVQIIAGLVSAEENATERIETLYENQVHTYPLGLARVVQATYISATINMLPPPE